MNRRPQQQHKRLNAACWSPDEDVLAALRQARRRVCGQRRGRAPAWDYFEHAYRYSVTTGILKSLLDGIDEVVKKAAPA